MFANNAQAKVYTTTMTYEILLIVVIGGIGSISGSCIATFLYVACSEWWLRFLDNAQSFSSPTALNRIVFIVLFAVIVVGGSAMLIRRRRKSGDSFWKELVVWVIALLMMLWWVWFIISRSLTIPFARNGFRMVVFSVIIMIVVLFFRKGIMGNRELTDLLFRQKRSKEVEK